MQILNEHHHSDAPAQLPAAESINGTRSVQRTLVLLRELSSRGEFGWRLSDLARQVGLDRATCHRMLACLIREGFAQRHDNDLKYYPGQMLFEMGLAVPPYQALRDHVDPKLAGLCHASGCIASFSLRSGSEVVCIAQQRGGVDLSAMMIRVGTRRPMVAAVGGIAILQQLPGDESARIVAENTQRELDTRGPRRLAALQRMRERSAQAGFGFTLGDLAPGVRALAVALNDVHGEPFAALTLTGTDATLHDERLRACHALAHATAAEIEVDAAQCLRRPARGTRH